MGKDKRKHETVSLGSEIEEFLDSIKLVSQKDGKTHSSKKKIKKSLNLLACWQQSVSKRVKDHTDNVVYDTQSEETELLVYVDSAVYAAELSMDKELYRIKMQESLGKEIKDIRFLVSRKARWKN